MKLSPLAIMQIEGAGRQRRCHLFLLGCFIVASFVLYFTFVVFDSRLGTTAEVSTLTLTDSSTVETHQRITLLLRMPGKVLKHKARYYCDLFRTTVLFWPPSYGKTVIVLDEESEMDHEFGEIVTRHTREHFPEYKLEVFFEPLPNDKSILENPGLARRPGYNRQLWSSFFLDLYTNDPIIAWTDSDVAFITPVTTSLIFSGSKLRVLGWDCSFHFRWVKAWARTSERALGLPYVADFMSYFPVYVYRDTFARCREHIMKHWNVTTFEEAFKLFYHDKNQLSPVSIILSYAWFFERDRYDWNIKICSDLTQFNKKFPSGATIGPEHVEDILSQPQATFHVPYGKFLSSHILISYCLSHEAAGNTPDICLKHNFSLRDNLDLLHHDLQYVKKVRPNPCSDNKLDYCLQVLGRHYKAVGLEMKEDGRKVEWKNVQTVEKLAKDLGITCKPLLY